MRKIHFLSLLYFVVISLFFCGNNFAQNSIEKGFNCFSMLVGKNASVDGSVMFAHNEDDGGEQLVNYYKVPRVQHKIGAEIIAKNGAEILQAPETYSYLWLEMPKMEFSDSYINEWGVTIASDQCTSREKDGELQDGGIGYWLRRLVAERAKTAKQGVKIAGELIEEYGYASSGRTYVIADQNEGWMLAAIYGKHWVAKRVPDDHVAVIPNYYTIGEINLADTTNYLGAADIIKYSITKGWYDPDIDGKFNFARAYSDSGNLNHNGNIHRMWRGVNLIAGTLHNPEILFLDEPTVGVDVQSKNVIIQHLKQLNNEGTTIVYTSHHMLEAEEFCTDVAIIDDGSIIARGHPTELIKSVEKASNLEEVYLNLTGGELRDYA